MLLTIIEEKSLTVMILQVECPIEVVLNCDTLANTAHEFSQERVSNTIGSTNNKTLRDCDQCLSFNLSQPVQSPSPRKTRSVRTNSRIFKQAMEVTVLAWIREIMAKNQIAEMDAAPKQTGTDRYLETGIYVM